MKNDYFRLLFMLLVLDFETHCEKILKVIKAHVNFLLMVTRNCVIFGLDLLFLS